MHRPTRFIYNGDKVSDECDVYSGHVCRLINSDGKVFAEIPANTDHVVPCLQAGAFRIGDTAGTLENIVACKLYRPGSVGFVSKSGGMSNEMYNVLSRATNGLYEGVPALPDVCV